MSAAGLALRCEAAAAPRRSILVVDDTPLLRELGALFLARAGRVITAASGEEALGVARLELPDLIVANVRMPGLDGPSLCRAIKQDPILGSTRIVLLASSQEAAERAVRAGADDVLAKPIDRVALLDAARRLLSEQPRGMPRIELAEPARLELLRTAWDGVARNLSRGGVFVESERLVRPRVEVGFEMHLPECDAVIASFAQVIWTRDADASNPPGMGLRFLGLDRRTARNLTDWVEERVPRHATRKEPPG